MGEKLYHILVIDDDTRLRNLLGKYLNEQGFYVSLAKDVMEAKRNMDNFIFDLLVLDVMMPGQNGIEFMQELRASKDCAKIPVLMLTAMGEAGSRIEGLEAGADDYLAKPFEPKELLLRINNILRRARDQSQSEVSCAFGDFIFNLGDLRLKKGEHYIHLTESEAKILAILCRNLSSAISREKLSALCGNIDERSIDVQITRLRRKIEKSPKQPHFLQTIRNYGYVLYR